MIRTLSSMAIAAAVTFACSAYANEGQQGGIPIPPVQAQPDLNKPKLNPSKLPWLTQSFRYK